MMMKGRLRMIKSLRNESGVILVLSAMSLVILLGVAAFAVDLGWIAYNQLEARKTAEAGALAGVVHMPLPGCADPTAGTDPYDVAIDTAGRNGYTVANGDTVTPADGGTCARLKVTVSRTIPTFFMKVFGYSSLTVAESATAEQLPPLRIGSDEPYLGEDPTVSGRNRNFFVAISGEDRSKNQGDAVAADRRNGGGSNPEYEVPSYYYAFEIPDGSSLIGSPVYVQAYDPQAHDAGGQGSGGPNDNTNDWVYPDPGAGVADDGWDSKTRFRVYAPDSTPNQWKDNSTLASGGCDDTYRGRSDSAGQENAAYNSAWEDTWVNLCSFTPGGSGTYIIEVSSDYGASDGTDMINGFSLRGSTNGGSGSGGAVASTNDLQVYGLGSMSLWQFDTGSNPVFKVARVDDVYAGSSLIISLWDVSDIGSSATIDFVGTTWQSGSEIDCQMRVLGDNVDVLGNNIPSGASWGSDSGGAGCRLNFNSGQYNNEWVQFKFDIPSTYTCGPGSGSSPASPGCWMFVSYSVSGSITDRTVWAASINGQPIHLIP